MRYTVTVATLPAGPMLTQYGKRAPITLDGASLGYPGNYGRPHGWDDTTTPRTERPVRFYWGQVGEETGEWERDAAFRRSMVF